MHPLFRLLTLASLFSPVTSANELQHWQAPSYIEDSFIEVSFGREYAERASHLAKWQGQITVFIEDTTGDSKLHRSLAWMHLEHLSDITGQVFKR
jgi:hypothetical protein